MGLGRAPARWAERFQKTLASRENGDQERGIRHSTSYHSFFQGYSERKVLHGRRARIERVYTADYYRYVQSDTAWKLYKPLYLLLLAGGAGCFLMAAAAPSQMNRTPWIGIPEVLSIIPFLWLAYLMAYQLPAGRLMTLHDFKMGARRLRAGAWACTAAAAAVTVLMLASAAISGQISVPADLRCILGMASCAACFLLMALLEQGRRHERVRNSAHMHRDANEIW